MRRSIGEKSKKKLCFCSNYLPLQIWTLKFCNHDISKAIIARSFKIGQLIEDDEEINIWRKSKKSYYVFFSSNHLPLQIWTLKICYHDIMKTIAAVSFKLL